MVDFFAYSQVQINKKTPGGIFAEFIAGDREEPPKGIEPLTRRLRSGCSAV